VFDDFRDPRPPSSEEQGLFLSLFFMVFDRPLRRCLPPSLFYFSSSMRFFLSPAFADVRLFFEGLSDVLAIEGL